MEDFAGLASDEAVDSEDLIESANEDEDDDDDDEGAKASVALARSVAACISNPLRCSSNARFFSNSEARWSERERQKWHGIVTKKQWKSV